MPTRIVPWIRILALAIAGASAGIPSPAGALPAPPSPRLLAAGEAEAYREPATGLVFDRVVGTWRGVGVHRYPEPALGVSIRYMAEEGVKADIYIYNFGLRTIPAGPASPIVKDHFKQALDDVFEAQRRGQYAMVTLSGSEEVSLGPGPGAPGALRAAFVIRQGPQDLISYLYLTGYKNHFFKMRLSFPAANAPACERAIYTFVGHIGALLGGEPARRSSAPARHPLAAVSANRVR